ncbi:conserved hypothetical protein [Uncinocarpus reesii 1704]|uniref:DUF221 domain-containing protein n=1 Tax=Uncinocarpus reesii (strain UAMH 1704) TaxID=336963 RepID=C4JZ17_UNCRE|nr:uncharacterized protein UREG_07418 [Uncinocarpus reesii 1704]EEP82553.1 conserved hypothetical protein [Uncinocarpus reesii 1704]
MESIIAARQNPGGPSSADKFLELLQDPFQSAFQERAFWASLGTSLGVTLGLALLFSLFRPRNSVVYAPKLKHADRKHAPPPLGKGMFAWITPIIKTREDEILDKVGMDATVFLRFTRMCRNIFLILSLIGCAIMIPINVTGSDNFTKGLSAFTTMTPMYVSNPKVLWGHVACAWGIDAIVAYFLWHNYRAMGRLRKRYFLSTEFQQSLHARTVMVTHIPKEYRTDEGLLRLTDEVNPTASIPRASIGRNVKELPALIDEHERVVRELEEILAKYFKNPDRLPAKRPTCRPIKDFRGENTPEKVDAIDYYTVRIRTLEAEIRYVRESIDKRNAMSYGFASWESIEHAHMAAYAARKKHPHGTNITLATRPNDIIWANLALSKAELRRKRFMNIVWSTILTVIWIAPNAMIAIFLADLAHLGLVWDAFQRSLARNPKVWSAVQGIASPAITSLVYLVLPIIFRRLAIRSGKATKSARERHVLHSLYAFFVFNNLIVFSVFSAIWSFVATVIREADRKKDAWEAISAGAFYVNVMTALCKVSPFWVTWLLQRNLGAAVDLMQLINMIWTFIARRWFSPTPRRAIEWTAPPPFDYASYFNYFLFYSTIAFCFASLQPIVLPVTALYFGVDSWLKKYLLLYVFITKTESGGRFWRAVFNRMIFALILANFILGLVIKAKGSWTMVFALVPLPILLVGFKLYCKSSFDDELLYYHRAIVSDPESSADGKTGKKAAERLSSRFGHPALYKPLTTPMVHAKAADALEKLFQGRQGMNSGAGDYSDIAMHRMSATEPGKASQPQDAPFEVVADHQLDFSYFKDRPDFREEFGGGIYGRPDDLITERSHTPKSFLAGHGSPSSSRPASPAPSQRSMTFNGPHGRFPNISDHPAFQSTDSNASGFYKQSNESERNLLYNPQGLPVRSSTDVASLDSRWQAEGSMAYSRYRSPSPYEPYRSR